MGYAGVAINRQRLQTERLRKGWTLRQLSDRTEELGKRVDFGNLSKYERGLITPAAPALLVIARALDLDVTDLALPLDDDSNGGKAA